MGTSKTPQELANKINGAAKAAETARKKALIEGAKLAKKTIEASRDQVTSSGRLRNVGKKGAKLSVGYQVSGDRATVQARGPWPIIESDIGPHVIGGKKKNGKRLRLPSGAIRRSVIHPGTKGKHPFRKGVEKSIDPVADVMGRTVLDAVYKSLG